MTGFAAIGIGAKLAGLRSAVKGAVDWLTGNAAHLLLFVLAGVFVWGWIGRHEAAKFERALASETAAHRADNATWAHASNTERASVKLLTKALHDQNAAVAGLKAESDRRVAANHRAVEKLAEGQRKAEAMSARMKAAFVASSGGQAGKDGQCASDPSVVAAAKGGVL